MKLYWSYNNEHLWFAEWDGKYYRWVYPQPGAFHHSVKNLLIAWDEYGYKHGKACPLVNALLGYNE